MAPGRQWTRCLSILTLAVLLLGSAAPAVEAAQSRAVLEMQQRAREQLARERLEQFVEHTFELFEISGELVSFRVHPNMTQSEVDLLDDRAGDLEDHVDDMLDYLSDAVPFVQGETDGLWIFNNPPDEATPLEDRLTLILALTNRLSPKLEQLVTLLRGEVDTTVTVDALEYEAAAPYLVVGGLEELLSITRGLRRAL